jgi:cobalt-precorrin 5A hydrolase
MRKAAPLLSDKWADPAIVVVDEALTWAIPLTGGHHGANQVAADLAAMGAVPAMTTASEVAGKQAVERRAEALDAHVETPDSTVATNLAVLDDDLGPVARLNGPQAVLVEDDVTILKRNRDAAEQNEEGENGDLEGEAEGKERPGLVLGTGTVSDVDPEQVHAAWKHALAAVGRDRDAVEFVATATRKADEPGLLAAAEAWDLGLVAFEKETLERFEGPSPTRSRELIGWPGIAEAAAIAGGREHELAREKERYDDAVTVAVGR